MTAAQGYDTASELNRKVQDTLNWLITGFHNRRITKQEFSIGIDTLFMAVSGLVDADFIHIITEAQKLCQET